MNLEEFLRERGSNTSPAQDELDIQMLLQRNAMTQAMNAPRQATMPMPETPLSQLLREFFLNQPPSTFTHEKQKEQERLRNRAGSLSSSLRGMLSK